MSAARNGATASRQPAGQASPGAATASPPSGDHQAQIIKSVEIGPRYDLHLVQTKGVPAPYYVAFFNKRVGSKPYNGGRGEYRNTLDEAEELFERRANLGPASKWRRP